MPINLLDLLTGGGGVNPDIPMIPMRNGGMGAPMLAPPSQQLSPDEQRRQELLAQAAAMFQPNQVPVPEAPSTGQNIGAAIADALVAYAMGRGANVPPPTAIETLRNRRAQREQATAYNTQEQTRAKNEAERFKIQSELGDIERRQSEASTLAKEERVRSTRNIEDLQDEARKLGIDPSGLGESALSARIAKANFEDISSKDTEKHRLRAESLLNAAAGSGVQVPQGIVNRLYSGEEEAFTEVRNAIAKKESAPKPEHEDPVLKRQMIKEQKEAEMEGKSIAINMRRGSTEVDASGNLVAPSIAQRAANGESLESIWRDYTEELDAKGVDGEARQKSESYFWKNVYPEFAKVVNERIMKPKEPPRQHRSQEAFKSKSIRSGPLG